MFPRVLPAFVLLLAGVLPSAAQPLPDRAPVRGAVVDEAGHPVAAAVLTIRRQDDSGVAAFWGGEALTGADGQFGFPRAEVGHYFVNVEAPGFAPLYNFPLDWDAASPSPRLELHHLTRLTLRVLAPDGNPLVGAPLYIRARSGEGALTSVRPVTDAAGQVALADLAPSTYSLVVVAQSGLAVNNALVVGAGTAPAPVEVKLRAGASLRVTAKDAEDIPLGGAALILFAQTPEEAARLGGQGADASDNWASVAAGAAPQAIITSEHEGTLTLPHLPPGHYTARLTLPDYGTQSRDVTLSEGAPTVWEAHFDAKSRTPVTCLIVDGAGKPVANTFVALRMLALLPDGTFGTPAPDPNTPADVPLDSASNGARVGRTDAKGVLSLYPVHAGKYRVWASRPTPDAWLRAPVAPEGPPIDVVIGPKGTYYARLQVP